MSTKVKANTSDDDLVNSWDVLGFKNLSLERSRKLDNELEGLIQFVMCELENNSKRFPNENESVGVDTKRTQK